MVGSFQESEWVSREAVRDSTVSGNDISYVNWVERVDRSAIGTLGGVKVQQYTIITVEFF
jgi:hypothetical protein